MLGSSSPVYAAASPDVEISEAQAYRSLNEPGDLFILIRYELPLGDGGAGTWCVLLNNDDGCGDTPPAPSEPTSLPQGLVFLSFLTSGFDGDLEARVQPPRIDHALGGLYFGPGHGFTWEDADIRICVESSDTAFAPRAKVCMPPSWIAGDGPLDPTPGTTAARDALATNLRQMMLNVQAERLFPLGSLVSSAGKITTAGRIFATEAFPIMDRVIPDAFQTGSSQIITGDYTPVTADSALQVAVDAVGQTSGVAADMDIVAQAYFGIDGSTLTILAALAVAFVSGGFVFVATKNPVLASFGFMVPLLVGTWLRAPTIAVIFTIIAILIVPTAAMFVRKTPQ